MKKKTKEEKEITIRINGWHFLAILFAYAGYDQKTYIGFIFAFIMWITPYIMDKK